MRLIRNIVLLLVCVSLAHCGKEDPVNNTLTVSPQALNFPQDGTSISFTIQTNAGAWTIDNSVSDWLTISTSSGTGSSSKITATVNTRTLTERSGTLTITAGNASPVTIPVKQVASGHLYLISADQPSVSFEKAGGTSTIKISTDAPAWTITSDANWLQLDKSTGSSGATTITLTTSPNPTEEVRTGNLNIEADGAATVILQVTQKGSMYPSYNVSPLVPDATGMSGNAVTLASKIKLGWNLGNTLEAIGGETAWGNPKASKALIDLAKQNGFNAVRLPCAWDQYMDNTTTAAIKTVWLDRVKEVVQYCVDNDMYVLLNIHWDGGWLENNCVPEKKDATNAKQRAFWEQIATHLRDFDEHLMFASANEPAVNDASEMAVLLSYHQTFINAVRSTGGKNSYRVLVVQGPSTDIDKTNTLMTTMPTDEIADRLMMEVHYYTPWNFCGLTADADWGKMFYYWGADNHSATDTDRNPTYGEEAYVDAEFAKMKTQFVDKGIPVLIGEFSAVRRTELTGDALALHLKSRAYFFEYIAHQAKLNGMLSFYWDAGNMGNDGSALFNRAHNVVYDQQAINALVTGIE